MVSSATRAIWGCSSTRWDGRSLFARGLGYCSQCYSFRRSSRAFVLKSGCCARSSAANTLSTAVVHGALFLDFFEEMGCDRTAYREIRTYEPFPAKPEHQTDR